jgi:hypothetical protein
VDKNLELKARALALAGFSPMRAVDPLAPLGIEAFARLKGMPANQKTWFASLIEREELGLAATRGTTSAPSPRL